MARETVVALRSLTNNLAIHIQYIFQLITVIRETIRFWLDPQIGGSGRCLPEGITGVKFSF